MRREQTPAQERRAQVWLKLPKKSLWLAKVPQTIAFIAVHTCWTATILLQPAWCRIRCPCAEQSAFLGTGKRQMNSFSSSQTRWCQSKRIQAICERKHNRLFLFNHRTIFLCKWISYMEPMKVFSLHRSVTWRKIFSARSCQTEATRLMYALNYRINVHRAVQPIQVEFVHRCWKTLKHQGTHLSVKRVLLKFHRTEEGHWQLSAKKNQIVFLSSNGQWKQEGCEGVSLNYPLARTLQGAGLHWPHKPHMPSLVDCQQSVVLSFWSHSSSVTIPRENNNCSCEFNLFSPTAKK